MSKRTSIEGGDQATADDAKARAVDETHEASISDDTKAPQHWAVGEEYEQSEFGRVDVYLKRKRIKLGHQREAQREHDTELASRPQIFEGVAIYINGHTETQLAALSEAITLYGGTYVPYLDKKSLVTHIVASNLTPKKREEFRKYQVVTEHWITESVKAGRLLDWKQFKLEGAGRALGADVEAGVDGATLQRTLFNFTKKHSESSDPIDVNDHPYLPRQPNRRAGQLLQDEDWRLKHTAVSSDYIDQYFKQSRLHHLSQWKAALPALVTRLKNELEAEGVKVRAPLTVVSSGKQRQLSGTARDGRVVLHIDFDSFFTSVALVSRPHLRGKPIAVCHATEGEGATSTSEIASCSYEARKFGVKNGMSLGRGRELCPEIATVPYQFDDYADKSAKLYKILLARGTAIQPVSVDEAYIEISDIELGPQVLEVAESIRTQIREQTGCEASIGIGHNVVLARLATIRAKPASSFWAAPDLVDDFLAPLSVDDLPKIGWSSANKLGEIGVATLADVRRVGLKKLQTALGPQVGQTVLNFANGIDSRPLEPMPERKTVSVELNYGIRFKSDEEVETFLRRDLSRVLATRMKEIAVRGRKVTLKVMRRHPDADKETPKFLGHGYCNTFNKTDVLRSYSDDADAISPTVVKLMKDLRIPPDELRGIAVSMTELVDETFAGPEQSVLTFKPTAKPLKPVVESSSVIELEPAPPAAQRRSVQPEESLILLDGPPADLPVPKRRSASVQPAPVVSAFFKPQKPQKGIGKAKQSHLSSKGKIDDLYRFAALMPTTITNEILSVMGIEMDFWQSVTASTLRNDMWSHQYSVQKERWRTDPFALNRARKAFGLEVIEGLLEDQTMNHAAAKLTLAQREAMIKPRPVLKIGKRKTVASYEEIREYVTAWFETWCDDEPDKEDVQRIGDHLVALVDRSKGAGWQLTKAVSVLKCWKTLIEEHWDQSVRSSAALAWRDALATVLKRVESQVNADSNRPGSMRLKL